MKKLLQRNKLVKYPFSNSSLSKLIGVHPRMVDFAFTLADIIDFKIIYGKRTDLEQNKLFLQGKSSKDGYKKKSNHQAKEDGFAYALDILPLPRGINMYLDDGTEDDLRWAQFDGLCHGVAFMMGITIRTGFKWRSCMMSSLERDVRDNTFPDGNHVEFVQDGIRS